MSRRRPRPALADRELALSWQSLSLLLGYPDEQLVRLAPTIQAATHELPDEVGAPLRRFVVHLEETPLSELQADYVETFDAHRRCNLYLTYFAHGDTRKRGVALLRFKQTYLRSGLVLDDGELPDHLCVVLEYAATIDQGLGRRLLLDHRAGLELLRLALHEQQSPWAPLLEALSATLPPLAGDEWEAVRRLAAEGPPAEEVGLDPYAGPRFDPALDTSFGRVADLPTPVVPGGRS